MQVNSFLGFLFYNYIYGICYVFVLINNKQPDSENCLGDLLKGLGLSFFIFYFSFGFN